MKVLHIGKQGNMEKYIKDAAFLQKLTIIDLPRGLSNEEYAGAAPDAEVMVVDAIARVDADLIRRFSKLKLIHSEGVAVNSFDSEQAAKQGIAVCNCKGMNARAVAEQALLLMLGCLRDVIGGDEDVRLGRQIEVKEGYIRDGNLRELSDCKVGLYGFGDIARSLAGILKAMGVPTYYYSRHRVEEAIEHELGVTYLPREELIATCNMISLHVPVTPETTNLVNADFFRQMPDNSYLINTARGEIVDTASLLAALESGKLCRAGLDTIAGEPVTLTNPIFEAKPSVLKKVVFSPHIGGITAASFAKGYRIIQENLERLLGGKELLNKCN